VEGTLVKDPVSREKPTAFCSFSVASYRFFKTETGIEKETSIFEVEVFGKLVESCQNLGKKGRGVRVVGRLRQKKWTDAKGMEQSNIVIVAEHIEFRPLQEGAQ
jgi:single-strand DNA-binding protein